MPDVEDAKRYRQRRHEQATAYMREDVARTLATVLVDWLDAPLDGSVWTIHARLKNYLEQMREHNAATDPEYRVTEIKIC